MIKPKNTLSDTSVTKTHLAHVTESAAPLGESVSVAHSKKVLLVVLGCTVITALLLTLALFQKQRTLPTQLENQSMVVTAQRRQPQATADLQSTTLVGAAVEEELAVAPELREQIVTEINSQSIQEGQSAQPQAAALPVQTPVSTPLPSPIAMGTAATAVNLDVDATSLQFSDVRLFNRGRLVPENGTVTPYSNYLVYLNLAADQQGKISQPVFFTFEWKIGEFKQQFGTAVATTTGPHFINFFSGMYDPIQYPQLEQANAATMVISAKEWSTNKPLPVLSKSVTYKLKPEANQPGTGGLRVTAVSDRSQPEVLDRKIIVGATITLFDETTRKKVSSLVTKSGSEFFRDLPPGKYIVQADYESAGSFAKTVEVAAGNHNYAYAMLIVPIKPDQVDDYTGSIEGQLVSPYAEFYQEVPIAGQTVELFRSVNGKAVHHATTTTDEWGLFNRPPLNPRP